MTAGAGDAGVRIAVCVSGAGSNLRALWGAQRRGSLGGSIVLVVADRECPALEWARAAGVATQLVRPDDHPNRASWDRALQAALEASGAGLVVLAGFMRLVGPGALEAFRGRILNVHPSLLPAFPGRHPVADALAAGVAVTGVTVHLVDATLDGGPIVAQEPVPIPPGDDEAGLLARIHAVEHRLLPRCVALAAVGALRVEGRRVLVDAGVAASFAPSPRALLSVADKEGLAELGAGLAELDFELVSTGGTARTLRDAGLEVTDVAAVTGFPEMLDGRVKTLHPRIAAGVLADRRLAGHREQLAVAAIEPFDLVVVNLYRFAEVAARPDVTTDELIEEIDIGGPTLVRAAAKNHVSVAVVTRPAQYAAVLGELRRLGRLSLATRQGLALDAFRLTADYDATIAKELSERLEAPERLGAREPTAPGEPPAPSGPDAPTEPDTPAEPDRFPALLTLALRRDALLRYGENPHQRAALYVLPGADPDAGPFARGARSLQGKPLSYNNLLDAAAAAGLARDLRERAVAIVKHGNPCGAAEGADLVDAWERALAGDPVSAYGGVVAVRGIVDAALAERLARLFLEVVVAEAFDADARRVLAPRTGLRLLEDPGITRPPTASVEVRSAGGAVLATDADSAADDPWTWQVATSRRPSAQETEDLDFAWRVVRHVRSNAIVLARDRGVVGVGAGQMSRVDSARLAVAKAGPDRARGASCASDAFFPFPDGLETCASAGVSAFIQPGGSQRDSDVIAAADAAGATMLLTGVRHFRH